jgi:hypothetical protein
MIYQVKNRFQNVPFKRNLRRCSKVNKSLVSLINVAAGIGHMDYTARHELLRRLVF